MVITELKKGDAVPFIHNYHYSKILPRLTKKYLGVVDNGELIGVITLGWGTQPLQTIRKIFSNHELTSDDYFEVTINQELIGRLYGGDWMFIPWSDEDYCSEL